MRLVTDRLPAGSPPYAAVTLDPVTQTARCTDGLSGLVRPGLRLFRLRAHRRR
ncbi:putative ATP-grasp-modified RiPP [Streptomyces sp. NPDC005526]|uniref:putative ATP-grasp-modified RiPP n=1 Tax=Streptomyces sp. NPDC005526 TaxID=3156885 RepID=UPI0033AAA8F3